MSDKVKFLTVNYSNPMGDFNVAVKPYTRKQLENLGRAHRVNKLNKKTHQYKDEVNNETYYPDLYERVIAGFGGCDDHPTYTENCKFCRPLREELRQVICYEVPNGNDPNMIVPFSVDDMVKMARTNHSFAEFVEFGILHFDELYGEKLKVEKEAREKTLLRQEIPNS